MFNQITLVGNLTRDIELRYTQSGTAIAKTAIATSHKYTSNGEKKEEVCFVDITAFGKSGEIMNQYLRKGSKVLIVGRLNFEQWTDNNTNQKRSKHSVIVETMKMLDSKQDNQSQQQPQQNQSYQPQQQQSGYGSQQRPQQPRSIPVEEENIPF
jgi:single-strand DNA-binding protein